MVLLPNVERTECQLSANELIKEAFAEAPEADLASLWTPCLDEDREPVREGGLG